MRPIPKQRTPFLTRMSERLDDLIGVVSPRAALERKQYRFAYDVLDSHRLRRKRTSLTGTGNAQLTESVLKSLRQIAQDMSRNNPLAVKLLAIERNGVVGPGVQIQARTDTPSLNEDLEALWREYMVDQPCDITGRWNFPKYLRTYYLSYRRDGDAGTVYGDDWLQMVEGGQIGTPYGVRQPESYTIISGVAISKTTGRILGYYVGTPQPAAYGMISSTEYRKCGVDEFHYMGNSERSTQLRSAPALTPAIEWIDKLTDYMDAELVAARVQACFTVFIQRPDANPTAYTGGVHASGETDDGRRVEKIAPGMIEYLNPGEQIAAAGMNRPGQMFDSTCRQYLSMIGGSLCLPLMLVTLDFQGATYMNARIAYQKAQEAWEGEQEEVVKPFCRRTWRWFIDRMVRERQLPASTLKRDDLYRHEVLCNRWPYVDPYREAQADQLQLDNMTTTRKGICARQGTEWDEVLLELQREAEQIAAVRGEPGPPDEKPEGESDAVPE